MMVSRLGSARVFDRARSARSQWHRPDADEFSVFRIYSMTKTDRLRGAMLLVEDGALLLTDPVSKWLPAFKDVKVWDRERRSGSRAADDGPGPFAPHRRACPTGS